MTSSSQERKRRRKSRQCQSRKRKAQAKLMRKIEKIDKDLAELKSNVCPSRKRTRSSSSSSSSESSSGESSSKSSTSSSSEDQSPQSSRRSSRRKYRSKSVPYHKSKYSRARDGSRRIPDGDFQKRQSGSKRKSRYTSYRSSTSHRESLERQSGTDKNKIAKKKPRAKDDTSETRLVVTNCESEEKSRRSDNTDGETRRRSTGDKITEMTMEVDDNNDADKSTKVPDIGEANHNDSAESGIVNVNKVVKINIKKTLTALTDIVKDYENNLSTESNRQKNESQVEDSRDKRKARKERNDSDYAVARKSYAKHKIHQRHETCSRNRPTNKDEEQPTIEEDKQNIIDKKSCIDNQSASGKLRKEPTDLLSDSPPNRSEEQQNFLEKEEQKHQVPELSEKDDHNSNIEESSKDDENFETNSTPRSNFVEESTPKTGDPNFASKSSIVDETTPQIRPARVLDAPRDSSIFEIRRRNDSELESFDVEQSSSRKLDSDEASGSEEARGAKRLKPNPPRDVSLLATPCPTRNNSPTVQSIVTLSHPVITVYMDTPTKATHGEEIRESHPRTTANESCDDIFSEDTDGESRVSAGKFELSNRILEDRIASTLAASSDNDEEGNDERAEKENSPIIDAEISVSNITEKVTEIEESAKEKNESSSDLIANENHESTTRIAKTDEQRKIDECRAKGTEGDAKENLDPETSKEEDEFTSEMVALSSGLVSMVDRQSELVPDVVKEEAEENLYPEVDKSLKDKVKTPTEELEDSESKIVAIDTRKQKDESPTTLRDESEKERPIEVFHRDEELTTEITEEKSVEDAESRRIEESRSTDESFEEKSNVARTITPCAVKFVAVKDDTQFKSKEFPPIAGKGEELPDMEVAIHEQEPSIDESDLSIDEILLTRDSEKLTQESKNDGKSPLSTVAETEEKISIEVSNSEELSAMTTTCSAGQAVEAVVTDTTEKDSDSVDEISKIATVEDNEHRFNIEASSNDGKSVSQNDDETSMMLDIREDNNLLGAKNDESIEGAKETEQKMSIDVSNDKESAIDGIDSTILVNEDKCTVETMTEDGVDAASRKEESLPIECEEDAKKLMIIDYSDEFVDSSDESVDSSDDSSDSTISQSMSMDEFLTDEAESDKDENLLNASVEGAKIIRNIEESPCSEGSTRERFETASEGSTAKLPGASATEETPKFVSQSSIESSSLADETDATDLILKIDETDESKSLNNEHSQAELSETKNSFCSSEVFSEKNSCTMDDDDGNDRTLMIDETDENDTTIMIDEAGENDVTLKFDEIDENDATLKFDESPPPLMENKETSFYFEDPHQDEEEAELTQNKPGDSTEKMAKVCRDALALDTESKIFAESSHNVEKSTEETFQNSSEVLTSQSAMSGVGIDESAEVSKTIKSPIAATQTGEAVVVAKITHHDSDSSDVNLAVSENTSANDSSSTSKASSTVEEITMNIDDMEVSSDDPNGSDDGTVSNSTIIASSTPNQASHMKNDESATIVATEKTTENIPIFRDDDVAFSDDARNTTSKFFATSSESTEQQSAKVDIASTDDNSLSMSLSDEKIADIDEESRIAIELSDINFDDEFLYEKYVESPRQVVASTSVSATKTAAANAKIAPSGTKVAGKRDESSFARADDAEKVGSDNEISNDKDRDTTNEKSFASVSKLSKGQTLETAKNMDVDSSSADIESSTETSRNEREILDEDDTPKIVAIPDEESATKDDETKMLFEAEKELSKNIETRDLNLDVDTLEKMNVKSTVIPFEVASRTEKMSQDTTTKRDELHVLDSEQSLVEIIDEIIGETPTLSNEASNTADEISDGETSENDDSLRKENAGSIVEFIVNNEIAHGNKTRSSNEEAEKESQSKDEEPLPRDLALSTAVDCVESVNVEKSQSAVNSPEKDKTATIEPIFEAIATEPTESTDQSVPMEIDEEKSLSKEGIRESNVAEQGHDNVGAISRRADGEREIFRKHGYIKTVDLSIEDQIEENVIQTSADHRDKSPEKNSRVDAKSSSDVLPQRLRLVDNSIRERENNEKVEYSPRKTDSLETIDSRAIDPILIADWTRIMKQGLANGVKEDLTKKHHDDDHVFPRTPTLNAELRRFMSDVLLKRDQHYVSTERQLCAAIIAIGKSITEIRRKNLSNDLAKGLSDAGEILSNLHYENGLERRSCIFSGLGAFVDAVAGRSRVDSFLFEDEKKIETADENKFPDKPAENSLQENIMETLIESSTALRESFGTSKIVDASTKSDKISLSKKIDDEQATSEKRDAGEEDEGVPLTKLSDIISSMENYIDDVEAKADFVEEIPVIRSNEAIACKSFLVARSKDRDNSSGINFETKSVDVSIIDDEPKETKNGASTSKNLETEQQEMDCEESSMSDRDSAASVINISDASSEEPNESTAEPATSASSAKVDEKSKTRDVPATSLDTRSETSMINEKIDDANNECVVTFARTRPLSLNMENYDDAVDRVASLDGRNKSQRDPSIRETLGDVPPEETIFSKNDDNEEPDECVVTYARTVPPLGTCKNENDDNDTTISANFFEQERCARSTESRAKTSEKSLLPAHNIASSSGFPDVKDNEHPVRTRLEEHSYYQSIQTSSATKYFENDGSFLTPLSSTRVLYSSDFHRFSQKKTYQRSADTKKLGDVTLNLRHVSEQPTRAYTPKFPSNVSTSMNRDLGVQERNPIGSLSLDRVSAISLLEPSQRKNSAPVAKPRVVSSHLDESSTSSQSVFVPSKSKSSLSGYKADYSSVPSAANLPKQYADRNANKLSRDSRATTSRKECSSASALPSSEKSERPLNYRQASFGGFSSENIDNRRSSSVESTRESQSGSSRSERPQLPRHIRVRDSSRLQRSAIARSSRVTVGGRNFDAWYKKNHGPEASTSDLCLLPAASPPQGSDLNKTVARKRVTASCRKALRTSSPPELPHDQSGSSRGSETQSPTRNVFATKYPLIRPPYGAAPETSKEIKESSNNNGGAIDKNKKKSK